MQSHFVPQLYGQILFDLWNHRDQIDNVDQMLQMTLKDGAKKHKDAMSKEYKRKEEKKKEELRAQREREEQKRMRKEQRAAARERHRIKLLQEKIQHETIGQAAVDEYHPQIKIYDVRDPNGKKDGIFLIGGFVGELIITFTCLLDYILANPQNQNFQFTADQIEAYLKDLLLTENLADGVLTLNLTRDPTIKEGSVPAEGEEQERLEVDDEAFLKFCLTKSNISDFGLGFFFDVLKDLVISKEFIETLYSVLVRMARKN